MDISSHNSPHEDPVHRSGAEHTDPQTARLPALPDRSNDLQRLVSRFDTLRLSGRVEPALEAGRQALEHDQANDNSIARTLLINTAERMAKLFSNQGMHASAVDCLMIAINKTSLQAEPAVQLCQLWRKVGSQRVLQQSYESAEIAFQHALQWAETAGTAALPELLSVRLNLCLAMQLQGKQREAVTEERRAVELSSQFSPPVFHRAAQVLLGFSAYAYQLGFPDKAERSLILAIEFLSKTDIPDPRLLKRAQSDLALACAAQQKFDRASSIVQNLIYQEKQEHAPAGVSEDLLAFEKMHADLLRKSGQPLRAANVLFSRFKHAEEFYPKNDMRLLPFLLDATFAAVDNADQKRTIELSRRAASISIQPCSPIMATLRCFEAICEKNTNLALQHLASAQQMYEVQLRREANPQTARALAYNNLHMAYLLLKIEPQPSIHTESLINSALKFFEQFEHDPSPPSGSVRAWETRGLFEQKSGSLDTAEETFSRALFLARRNHGYLHSRLGAVTLENCAGLYRAKYDLYADPADLVKEKDLLEEAVAIRDKLGFDTSQSTLRSYSRIAEILEAQNEIERARQVREEVATRQGLARLQMGEPFVSNESFPYGDSFGTDL